MQYINEVIKEDLDLLIQNRAINIYADSINEHVVEMLITHLYGENRVDTTKIHKVSMITKHDSLEIGSYLNKIINTNYMLHSKHIEHLKELIHPYTIPKPPFRPKSKTGKLFRTIDVNDDKYLAIKIPRARVVVKVKKK